MKDERSSGSIVNEGLAIRVEKVLAEIRDLLGPDGGTLELVEITIDGIVRVHLSGTCTTCRPADLPTLQAGIERLMQSEIPEVLRVEAV